MSETGATDTLEWRGRTGPFTVSLGDGVFHPTHTSRTLAEALEIELGDTVIDVGCGSGVLSFVAARLGAGRVIGSGPSARGGGGARPRGPRRPRGGGRPAPSCPRRCSRASARTSVSRPAVASTSQP